jgi:outer membrane protein OmpA-like peptidoglycan-associated protein
MTRARTRARAVAGILAAGLLSACTQTEVVLLPEDDGQAASGALALLDDGGGGERAVLDRPNTRLFDGAGGTDEEPVTAAQVQARYGALIGALPMPPTHYTLYFAEGTTRILPRSQDDLEALLAEVAQRPGADVQVTGHTDTLGSIPDNDALSIRRAQAVRGLLIDKGLDPDLIRAVGRGERELLEPTADAVRHPPNRRVEVTVR